MHAFIYTFNTPKHKYTQSYINKYLSLKCLSLSLYFTTHTLMNEQWDEGVSGEVSSNDGYLMLF